MPKGKKGTLIGVYLSVDPSEYIPLERITTAREQARRKGHTFKSGKRRIRFDGVTLDVIVVTTRASL